MNISDQPLQEISLAPASDTGVSATDGITSDNTPTLQLIIHSR